MSKYGTGKRDYEGDEDDSAETIWVQVEIFDTTRLALLVREMPKAIWIPKSQVKDFSIEGGKDDLEQLERRDEAKLELPLWLVRRAGIEDQECKP